MSPSGFVLVFNGHSELDWVPNMIPGEKCRRLPE